MDIKQFRKEGGLWFVIVLGVVEQLQGGRTTLMRDRATLLISGGEFCSLPMWDKSIIIAELYMRNNKYNW